MSALLEVERLDCRGLVCPAPILKIAQRARRAGGAPLLLEVRADDPDFARDVSAWVRASGAALLELEEGEVQRALLSLNGARTSKPPAAPAPLSPLPGLSPSAPPARVDDALLPAAPAVELDVRALSDAAAVLRLSVQLASAPATPVALRARGAAFVPRLRAWATATGSRLHELELHGDELRVTVIPEEGLDAELDLLGVPAEPVAPDPSALAMPEEASLAPLAAPGCALLVLHNDHEALLAALMVANAAASQGMDTQLFFSFWGVNLLRAETPSSVGARPSLAQRLMRWWMPAGPARQPLGQLHLGGLGKGVMNHLMRDRNMLSLEELMATAEGQGVSYVVCTMSMELMGLDKDDLQPRSNLTFAGVNAFVERAAEAKLSMVF